MNSRAIILLLAVLLLTSCAPDPRKVAEADKTRIEAEQFAASQEQMRRHAEEQHAMDMQDRAAAQAAWQNALNGVINTGVFFAKITLAMLLLGIGVMGVWSMYGTTKAYNRWVEVRANLIHLNPKTGTFPMLLTYIGNGRYTAMLPDNTVLELDSRNEPDRIKLRGLLDIQHTAVLANNARASLRPNEIAQIPAPHVIDMESER
jgi:hypothetical protein